MTGSGYERILHSRPNSDGNFFFGTSANNFTTFTGGGLTNGIGLGGWNDVAANSPSQTVAASGSILAMSTDGTTLTPYVNGTAQTNKTGTMNAFTGMRLGGCLTSACGTQSYDGDVSEVLTFPTVLSVEDRQKVEGYLAWKYGLQTQLPSNHPYKTTQPTPTTAAVGQTLIGTEGKWNMGTSATNFYDQSWWRCSDARAASDYAPAGCNKTSNLANAYKVTSADNSKHLVYGTQATNSAGDNEAYSPSVAAGLVTPANSSLPTLTADSQTPTVSGGRGSWNYLPDSYTSQFQICSQASDPTSCANASGPGSTTLSYTPVALDMGKWLRLSVTATNAAGSSTSSSQTLKLDPPVNTSAPSFSGSLIAGQTLNGNKGTWTGTLNATTSYQWQSSSDGTIWADISGATSSNYTITDAVSEKYLRLKVTQASTTTVIAYSTSGANNATGGLVTPSAAPTVTVTGPGTTTSTSASVSWSVNNSVTAGSSQCRMDAGAWVSCTSPWTPAGQSTNAFGISHTVDVKNTNRVGEGATASASWTTNPPNNVSVTWTAYPAGVGYASGSSQGSFSVGGTVGYIQCYSTADATWRDCGSPGTFNTGGVCSNQNAYIRAWNATSGWVQNNDAPSFHRNCDPASAWLYWAGAQYPTTGAGGNHYINQDMVSQAHPDYCRMDYQKFYISGNSGGTVAPEEGLMWGPAAWCNNPVHGFGSSSSYSYYARHTRHIVANDGSSDRWDNSYANYNSNYDGWHRVR